MPQVAALREALAQRHVNTQGTRQILMAKLTEELKKVGGGGGQVVCFWLIVVFAGGGQFEGWCSCAHVLCSLTF